jgi:hypothetical protein
MGGAEVSRTDFVVVIHFILILIPVPRAVTLRGGAVLCCSNDGIILYERGRPARQPIWERPATRVEDASGTEHKPPKLIRLGPENPSGGSDSG